MKFEFAWSDDGVNRLMREFPEIVREETEKRIRIIVARLEKDVVENTPSGIGGAAGLRGSIHGRVESDGSRHLGIVSTASPYGEVVEVGRKPGSFPPVAPIARWAQVKLGVSADDAESVGLLIARKIYHKGTTGAKMFEKAWNQDRPWVESQLSMILPAVIARIHEL